MKFDFCSRLWVKAVALVLALACGVGAGLCWLYCGIHWNTLFQAGSYTDSGEWYRALSSCCDRLNVRLELEWKLLSGEELTYLDQQQHQTLLQQLDPAVTNFRYTVRDNTTGALLYSSAGKDSLRNVEQAYTTLRTHYLPYTSLDELGAFYVHDPDTGTYTWYDADSGVDLAITSSIPADLDELALILGRDAQISTQWAIEYGVDAALDVQDGFTAARDRFTWGDIRFFYLAIALTAAFLLLWVVLMCCAGRRRGHEEYVLTWLDRIPYDVLLALIVWAGIFLLAAVLAGMEGYLYSGSVHPCVPLSAAAAALAALLALVLAGSMSTAARCKTRTLLRNTLLWRVGAWLRRVCRRVWSALTFIAARADLTLRVVLGSMGFLGVNAVLAMGLFAGGSWMCLLLLTVFNAAVLMLVCRWTVAWADLRAATAAIVGGHPDQSVDVSRMQFFPALRQHAQQLGDLGGTIDLAVKERMKSERMKAELITNVSHDLKTPLTSIINYVDLLKKVDIQDPKAAEYIDVLDRKSQRLKRLTEDLVEASKASTGTLAVEKERLGMAQLVTQALGEYAERFAGGSLTPVVSLPEEEPFVSADGRHMWRILDNLLSNCVKYALPGTRVYLTLTQEDNMVALSVKNISAQQLNIPAQQLMERFVRGDESRTTEGSGLGLSIARSLTELQGGAFQLDIDGDLFKATARFPRA